MSKPNLGQWPAFVLTILVIIYWIGVFTGSFKHRSIGWSNYDPDTWIHAGLAAVTPYLMIGAVIQWSRAKTNDDEV